MTTKELHNKIKQMPRQEQLLLAHWILDIMTRQPESKEAKQKPDNPLLAIAGRFSSDPSDTAKRAEDILMDAVNPISGLSIE